jgi:hypothetical protein
MKEYVAASQPRLDISVLNKDNQLKSLFDKRLTHVDLHHHIVHMLYDEPIILCQNQTYVRSGCIRNCHLRVGTHPRARVSHSHGNQVDPV